MIYSTDEVTERAKRYIEEIAKALNEKSIEARVIYHLPGYAIIAQSNDIEARIEIDEQYYTGSPRRNQMLYARIGGYPKIKIVREKQKSIRPEKIVEIVLAIIEAERQRQLDNHERKRKAAIAFEVVQRTGYKIGEFSVTATSEGKIKITAQFDPNDFDLIAAKLKDIKAEHNE